MYGTGGEQYFFFFYKYCTYVYIQCIIIQSDTIEFQTNLSIYDQITQYTNSSSHSHLFLKNYCNSCILHYLQLYKVPPEIHLLNHQRQTWDLWTCKLSVIMSKLWGLIVSRLQIVHKIQINVQLLGLWRSAFYLVF
jgi:hypothetical protein